MKKILAAILLAFALVASHTACAAETEPPPFTPVLPGPPSASPGNDLSRLMHLLDEDDDKPAAKMECKTKPCVFGYRLSGGITEQAQEKFEKWMDAAVAAKPDAIMVEINTPGGSLTAGHEISRIIEHAPVMVACVVDGESYSMGMYILQSCDVRVMTKRSSLMIHQVSLMVGQGARITQSTLDEMKVRIVVATRGYVEWVAHRMKVSVDAVLARVANGGEWWMNWEEGLKVGAVDKVIDGPPEKYFQLLQKGQR